MSPPPSRVQAVLDGTGIVGGSSPYPGFTGFYGSHVWGQPYAQPNGELVVELRPVTGLTIAGNFGVGNNYITTQSYGWQHGHPFDLTQAYIDYCPGGGVFCMRAGREYDTFGVETVRADQTDFTTRSISFNIMPYTRTMASLGLVNDQATFRVGVSRGVDNIADNTRYPWMFAYFNYTGTRASVFSNFQAGPGEPNVSSLWRFNADLGITYDPITALRLGFYGFYSSEQTPSAEWKYSGGGYFYLRGRAEGSHVGGVLRMGFTHDDGLRTATDTMPLGPVLNLMQMTGGVNVYATDWLQFRLQGDLLIAADNSPLFAGQTILPRATLQVIINPFVEFGGSH